MKKKIKLLITTILMMSVMVGCGSKSSTPTVSEEDKPVEVMMQDNEVAEVKAEDIDVAVTADFAYMGLSKFEENVDNGIIYVNHYNITVEDNANDLVDSLGKNEVHFATLPLGIALEMYNSDEYVYDVRALAILNTGGVYLVENGDSVKSMNKLAGETIYALSEYSAYKMELLYILSENGVDVDGIEFEYVDSYEDAFEIEGAIVVMTEPYASDFVENNDGNVCFDFEDEWDKIMEENEIPAPFITSVIVSNSEFIESKPNIIREFLMFANTSVNALNLNFEEGNNILEDYGVSDEAIENTNITFIAGEDMVHFTGAYFFALEEMDGFEDIGDLPDDDFFFWG